MLRYIELDRYRGGQCTGSYLSRLHYLEDWLHDNDRRRLVEDLTRRLGGVRVAQSADEMTMNWRSYRYMNNNPDLRAASSRWKRACQTRTLRDPEGSGARSKRSSIRRLIGITTHDGSRIGTSHVGVAGRMPGIHFMHASAPHNYGKVVLDTRLMNYLARFRTDAGILVARPLK